MNTTVGEASPKEGCKQVASKRHARPPRSSTRLKPHHPPIDEWISDCGRGLLVTSQNLEDVALGEAVLLCPLPDTTGI
jgi:hypothetical protein